MPFTKNNFLVELELDELDPSKVKITGKITDFGLSSVLSSGTIGANSMLSAAFRWQAPELQEIEECEPEKRVPLLEKADVWSFALTSLEVRSLYLSHRTILRWLCIGCRR